ncbi:MAG: stage 0 sporulation family protein [Clostridiales bacterium]|nr:stage 0 sporulation family protein [Clostridiales bacterium]
MSEVVGIKFKDSGKLYYFAPKGLTFEKGEGAIVETARGMEFGTVVIANTDVPDADIKGDLKPVVRKASAEDIAKHQENLNKRHSSIRTAQEMANKRKLDMKFVDAEFTFDNSKVLFYFTSDNRIDFRDLVKEMAATFHMRIELRQIGIRDECKMKGGLGPCGRVCCCNDYMNDFERVSIKMAKHQGLSLNPGKISGLCGRLMCCLKFEDDYYADTLKFMPKVGSEIVTPKGKGVVVSIDVLRQTVVVKTTDASETVVNDEYNLEQLGITPVYPDRCSGCADCQNNDGDPDDEDDTDILPDTEE